MPNRIEGSARGALTLGVLFTCSVLAAPGQSYALALYLEPLAAAIGVGRVEVAALFAGATLAAAAVLPLVGPLADRWTARRYLAAVLALIAAALLALSVSRSLAAAGAAFFLLRLLCQGALGVGTLTAVMRGFRSHRGRALAIVGAGYTVGEFAAPGVISALQDAVGWRPSLALAAAAYVLVAVALLSLLREPRKLEPGMARPPRAALEAPPVVAQVVRSRVFWLLASSLAIAPLVLTGILLHQPAIFRSLGWGADSVPAALRTYAVASLAAAYGCGWLLERVPTRWGVVASLVALAAAVAVPAWAGGWPGARHLYAGLLGVASGSSSAANGLVWPEYFGLAALGSIKGVVTAVRNGATALGAAAVALAGEGAGYALPLALCAGLALAAAALVAAAVPPPDRSRADRAAGARPDGDAHVALRCEATT